MKNNRQSAQGNSELRREADAEAFPRCASAQSLGAGTSDSDLLVRIPILLVELIRLAERDSGWERSE